MTPLELKTCPDCKQPYIDMWVHKDRVLGSCPYPEEDEKAEKGEHPDGF